MVNQFSDAEKMAKTTIAQSKERISPWKLKVEQVETCNCEYGCPCNFSGFPSNGFCQAIIFHRIIEGHYGNTKLDGLAAIKVGSWPKAIHEGNGTFQVYASKEACREQRDSLVQIYYGRAKGNGPFALFAKTVKYVLEPQFVEIKYKMNGRNSSFSVAGVLDVKIESFKNPVTGEDHDAIIRLPKGFIWKEAHAAMSKVMRVVSPSLTFDHSGQNAFYVSELEFSGP